MARHFAPAERTNFDPKASRACKKSVNALCAVKEFLSVTALAAPEEDWQFQFNTEAAVAIIDAAIRRAFDEETVAMAKAARANNEYGAYLRFCHRRNIGPASGL